MLRGDATGRHHAQENYQPAAESVKGAAAASGGGLLHKSGGAQRVPLKAANAGNVNSPYEGVRAESSAMDTDARGESRSGAREPEEQVNMCPLPSTHSNTHRAVCQHLRLSPLVVWTQSQVSRSLGLSGFSSMILEWWCCE